MAVLGNSGTIPNDLLYLLYEEGVLTQLIPRQSKIIYK